MMYRLISISMSVLIPLVAATIVRASTVTILDLNDTGPTLSTASTRYVVLSSLSESPGNLIGNLNIGVFAPTGATFGGTTIPDYFLPSAGGFPDIQNAFVASESGGNQVSDILGFSTTPLPGFGAPFALFFISDRNPPTLACAQTLHGCNVVENGPIQGTITWNLPAGGTVVDTIQFQSDVSEVPEPSAILLLLPAVAGCLLFTANRRRSA